MRITRSIIQGGTDDPTMKQLADELGWSVWQAFDRLWWMGFYTVNSETHTLPPDKYEEARRLLKNYKQYLTSAKS